MATKKQPVKKTKLLTNELVTTGRSQGEEIVIALLRINFPGIKIERNDKSVLGRQELDIHLVDYKIAIEIDGITHSKPIYGQVRFEESLARDRKKEVKLQELGFLLYRIDIGPVEKEKLYTFIKEHMNTTLIPELKKVIPARYLNPSRQSLQA
jgi:very-short-patch-repair endonuclease